jgi:hypothetical protein
MSIWATNRFGKALLWLLGSLALLGAPLASANAQSVYGPVDEPARPNQIQSSQSASDWDGQLSVSAIYAKRARDLLSDFDRSGVGAAAVLGRNFGSDWTRFRLEGSASTDKFATTYGAEAELTQKLSQAIAVRISASGTKHAVTLESLDVDQATLRAEVTIAVGKTRIKTYARHRWRGYNDISGGTGTGWQLGGGLRQSFGSFHWIELSAAHDRIAATNGFHSYRRNMVSVDYSKPITKRLRLVAGIERREWTYSGRHVGDVATAALRHDRLFRPDLGLSYGRSKGLYARATAGYDFYRSNDVRYSGDGPRLRFSIGYRF